MSKRFLALAIVSRSVIFGSDAEDDNDVGMNGGRGTGRAMEEEEEDNDDAEAVRRGGIEVGKDGGTL